MCWTQWSVGFDVQMCTDSTVRCRAFSFPVVEYWKVLSMLYWTILFPVWLNVEENVCFVFDCLLVSFVGLFEVCFLTCLLNHYYKLIVSLFISLCFTLKWPKVLSSNVLTCFIYLCFSVEAYLYYCNDSRSKCMRVVFVKQSSFWRLISNLRNEILTEGNTDNESVLCRRIRCRVEK